MKEIYERRFVKEAIFQGNAGEQLLFTIDLSKVSDIKHFVDQLFDSHIGVKVNKRATNLTNRKKAKIVIPDTSDSICAFRSVLLMNDFYDTDLRKIFNSVQRY